MLARHAESLFWAGRYLERAEDTARLLDVTYHGSLQDTGDTDHDPWAAVLEILQTRVEFDELDVELDAASVSAFLVLDRSNPGSILSATAAARENFRVVREHLSTEMWETVNRFHLDLRQRNLHDDLSGEPYRLYELVRVNCQAFGGIAAQSMPRDEAYSFLRLGWMIERALITCRLLAVNYPTLSADNYHSMLLTLRSGSALEAYRRSFQSSTNPTHVAAFLLQSANFPRSVYFCLERAKHSLSSIQDSGARDRAGRLLGRVCSQVEFADIGELVAEGMTEALDRLQSDIGDIANAVAHQYFRIGEQSALNPQFVLPGETLV